MSKVDAQRAMREARYAAFQAGRAARSTPAAGPAPARAAAPAPEKPAPEKPAPEKPAPERPAPVESLEVRVAPAGEVTPAAEVNLVQAPAAEVADASGASEPAAEEQRCGHRNLGGKTCSRPAGHAEKNHRYK